MSNELTGEQVKKFWEWCGFSSNAMKLSEGGWNYPSGGWDIRLPQIDLNNLFRYAVPKVPKFSMVELYQENHLWTCALWINHKDEHNGLYVTYRDMIKGNNEDPAQALAQAIYQVMEATNG